jgi:2-amino-4-hydroxy-6-hydroxymethyldihydropteridine diphosphokinase
MGTLALIGLGSNLGDRKAQLDRGISALSASEGTTLRAVSRYHETSPVGGPAGQGAFLNAAAALETSLEPEPLLDRFHAIEAESGRVRAERWGARTLDLDLLLFGDRAIRTPRLEVPHPRMALRRFVLAPLAEIAPDAVDPLTRRTVQDLLGNLDRRPSYLAFAGKPDWGALYFGKPPIQRPSLYRHVTDALSARAVEDRFPVLGPRVSSLLENVRMSSMDRREEVHLWLAPGFWPTSELGDTWVASHFWYDAFYLAIDTLKTGRPRALQYKDEFLDERQKVLRPTLVVASPKQSQRLGLRDPRLAWQRPIGWDTPILLADTDEPGAAEEILAACAATRSG